MKNKTVFRKFSEIYIAKLVLKIFNIKKLIKIKINKLNLISRYLIIKKALIS